MACASADPSSAIKTASRAVLRGSAGRSPIRIAISAPTKPIRPRMIIRVRAASAPCLCEKQKGEKEAKLPYHKRKYRRFAPNAPHSVNRRSDA